MIRHVLDAIIDEFNAGRCLRDIANHWACRCTVPGPGMRRAGETLVRRYKENGISAAELIPYPADDQTESLDGHRNPLEWQPRSAWLRVASPEDSACEVCNYADEPISLICNSHSTPPEGVEAELVIPAGPIQADKIEPGQWAGKIVLANQFPSTIAAAAHKAGAIGIISDCICPPWLKQHPPVREPEDVPDLVMWTILPGRRSDPPLFGFNLSPRQGRRLRDLAAASETPLRMKAMVDAELVEGSSDLVNAARPGTDLRHEEIWVLAHLSEPGARDNASGCCLSLEIARMLRALTERGTLPPLRRTIRFMHAVEVNGFLPYIHEHRGDLPNVAAGLCADSVAQDFRICGGEAVLFLSSEQNASFVDGLMQYLLQTVHDEPACRFSADNYANYPWHTEPYFGNDAFISDGFFDIPTPQISVWPDKYYHSNQDTPDQIDPGTLTRSAAVMGTFVYALAAAGEQEAAWFANLAAQDWKQRVCLRTRDALSADEPEPRLAGEIRHMGLQAQDAVTQTARFAPDSDTLRERLAALTSDLAEFAALEAQAAQQSLGTPAPPLPDQVAQEDDNPELELIPRRLRWRLPGRDILGEKIDDALNALRTSHNTDAGRIWPWINGRRTVHEILQRLDFGGPVPVAPLIDCLRLLEQAGVIILDAPAHRSSVTTPVLSTVRSPGGTASHIETGTPQRGRGCHAATDSEPR